MPARMIEIISPAGFEGFFRELSDMTAAAGFGLGRRRARRPLRTPVRSPDWLADLIARYGLTPMPRG